MTWPLSFFFSSRRRHTRLQGDWSSDVCSSDLISWYYLEGRGVFILRQSSTKFRGHQADFSIGDFGRQRILDRFHALSAELLDACLIFFTPWGRNPLRIELQAPALNKFRHKVNNRGEPALANLRD